MAVDHGAPELGAYPVELITERSHLIRGIFIAGNNLVNGIDDHGDVVLLLSPADQLRSELVHRHGASSEIPDVEIVERSRSPADRFVDVCEAVQAARLRELEIDIHDAPLRAVESEPVPSLGDRDRELDQSVGFARL